jgi:hypothetical protein
MAPRPDESDHVVTTLVHRFVEEAWNQRRLEILDEILVPDYTIRSLQHGAKERRLIGIDAVKHHIHEFLSAFPDLQLALEELVVEGERAAAYCRFRGTHKENPAPWSSAETKAARKINPPSVPKPRKPTSTGLEPSLGTHQDRRRARPPVAI